MSAGRYEHTCWLAVVDALRATGAVTEEDCKALASASPTTPGQRVFEAIRAWGDAYAALQMDINAQEAH